MPVSKKKLLQLVLVNWQNECMKPQLFVGAEPPKPEKLQTVQNREDFPLKPCGGLWTSTFYPDMGSDWVQWCVGNSIRPGLWQNYLVYPKQDARILQIDSYEDLESLMGQYEYSPMKEKFDTGFELPGILRGLNYEEIAKKYDAIHLTTRGERTTHLSFPFSMYSWDCESTLWFRWVFEKVQHLGQVEWE